MKILSLFDGISCARIAFERAGIPVELYYASEIDKYAKQISLKNYPDILQIGDIKNIQTHLIKNIDLLIGGSPCQDLSIAKKDRKGLSGERSGLFWEYVRILKEIKPGYFILENVNSMPKEAKDVISETLGVQPIMINAALVSAQNRKRLFWVGSLQTDGTYAQVEITQPEDRGILLKDIIQPNSEVDERMMVNGKSFAITASYNGAVAWNSIEKKQRTMIRVASLNSGGQGDRIYSIKGKSVALSANGGGRGAKTGLYAVASRTYPRIKTDGIKRHKQIEVRKDNKSNAITSVGTDSMIMENYQIRKLTPIECERLQGLAEKEQSCIIRVCLDQQNKNVNVEDKNLKSQNVVGNVEKDNLKENVLSVKKNLNTNNQQINKPAQPDVLINCEENKVEIHSQGKLLASVNGADWKQSVHHLKQIDDFVQIAVGINTIAEKITHFGEEELHQKNNLSVVKESGNNVVSLYGKEIMQLANDARKDLTILNKLLKSTISDLSTREGKEQIIQTLFSYVVLAIFGYIPKKIINKNILTFQINTKVGYTYSVSNTQRYKCLGNAFNVDVVAHILKSIF